MNQIEKKHFDAAGAMSEVFANRLGGESRAVHSETVIAAAARMAGTMLLRSFGIDTSKMPVGAAILSEQANEKGPMLLNIVIISSCTICKIYICPSTEIFYVFYFMVLTIKSLNGLNERDSLMTTYSSYKFNNTAFEIIVEVEDGYFSPFKVKFYCLDKH
jgi:hypothetical protein